MKLIGENNKAIQCDCGGRLYYRVNIYKCFDTFKCYDCQKEPTEKFTRIELKSHFVFLGNPDDRQWLTKEDTVGWTSHTEAELNDYAFFYITAPVSAIVGYGHISGGYKNEDISCKYYDRWMSEILVNDNSQHIPISYLRELFPEWRWLKYPRQNTQIPADIVKPFLELVKYV